MTDDEIDTRIAFVKLFDETRDLMARSSDQARRRVNNRTVIARLTEARPAKAALPAPAHVPMVPTVVTEVAPITERDLSTGLGVSLRSIAKAIARGEIRTIKRKGKPRLLEISSTSKWLHEMHHISPSALLDVHREQEN